MPQTTAGKVALASFTWEIVDNKLRLLHYTGTEKNVVIPSKYDGKSVEIIADMCFYGTHAETVTVPDTLTTIENGAFGSSSVRVLNISKSVHAIGTFLFELSSSIEEVNVHKDNPFLCSVDGVLFDKNKRKILYYPHSKAGKAYAIPNSVMVIETGTFSHCKLEVITVPASVVYMSRSVLETFGQFNLRFSSQIQANRHSALKCVDKPL